MANKKIDVYVLGPAKTCILRCNPRSYAIKTRRLWPTTRQLRRGPPWGEPRACKGNRRPRKGNRGPCNRNQPPFNCTKPLLRERKISPKFFGPKFFHGRPRGMSVPKCLFFQDLEGLTEVFGRMSAGISGQKLPLWAEISFLTSNCTLSSYGCIIVGVRVDP